MKLNSIQERIIELFTVFVTQVRGATAMSRTDINRVSEEVLLPIFSTVFNCQHLKNLNHTQRSNYPSIDLGDQESRVAFQVTATNNTERIKQTLTKFVKHELYREYDRLIIYILTEKQNSYSGRGFEKIIQGKFYFDKDRDIIDYRDLLKVISSFQVNEARAIERILEANFGNNETLAATQSAELDLRVSEYLAALHVYCSKWPYITLFESLPLTIPKEVYVPLSVRPLLSGRQETDFCKESGAESHSITSILSESPTKHVLVRGGAGSGKTSYLRYVAENVWDNAEKLGLSGSYIPMLIPLRRFASHSGSIERRLASILADELSLLRELPEGFLLDWPRKLGMKWLLLFDGLDEVPSDQYVNLSQWLEALLRSMGEHRVVITLRPLEHGHNSLYQTIKRSGRFAEYELLPFSAEQMRELGKHWLGDDAEAFERQLTRIALGATAGTPLFITVAAKVFLAEGTIPSRPDMLIGQFVDILLRETNQRELQAELGERLYKVSKTVLAMLAWELTTNSNPTEATLIAAAANYLQQTFSSNPDEAKHDAKRFMSVMAVRSGCFTRQGGVYDFIHPTVRSYFVAWHFKDRAGDDLRKLELVFYFCFSPNFHDALFMLLLMISENKVMTAHLLRFAYRQSRWQRLFRIQKERILFATEFVAECLVQGCYVDSKTRASVEKEIKRAIRSKRIYSGYRILFLRLLGLLGQRKLAGSILLKLARLEHDDLHKAAAISIMGELRCVDELVALAVDKDTPSRYRQYSIGALGDLKRVLESGMLSERHWVDNKVSVESHEFSMQLNICAATTKMIRSPTLPAETRTSAVILLTALDYIDELWQLSIDRHLSPELRSLALLGYLQRTDEETLSSLPIQNSLHYIGEPLSDLLSRSENIQIADREIQHIIIRKMAVLILKDWRKVDDFISQCADEANVIDFSLVARDLKKNLVVMFSWVATNRE